jgi:hypothetical protein
VIDRRVLAMLHPSGDVPERVTDELVSAGIWKPHRRGWEVVEFATHQTTKAQHDAAREVSRRSTKKWREQQRRESSGDGSRDTSRQPSRKARQGKEGKARTQLEAQLPEGASVDRCDTCLALLDDCSCGWGPNASRKDSR